MLGALQGSQSILIHSNYRANFSQTAKRRTDINKETAEQNVIPVSTR